MSPSPIRIAVAPAAEYQTYRLLFDMLSAGLQVTFEPYAASQYAGVQGLISLSDDEKLADEATKNGLSLYQIHSSNPFVASPQSKIAFSSAASLDRAFRNSNLHDPSISKWFRVPLVSEPLAAVENNPVWCIAQHNGATAHHVGLELPAFAASDLFHQHFRGTRWFALVPLLHFLRHLLGPEGREFPESRATFIIDDPNLHRHSYGYIDFQALVKHAAAHNYHATIATVPLDSWYFNRDVAALFRAHRDRLSLMMHGVNHIADELARDYSEPQALGLLADGLRRMAAFESRSGVKVDRVMAAPHGAFAEPIADPMLRLGYEAGCVSVGSLIRWNPRKHWSPALGLPVVQAMGLGAFPVFHRVGTNEVDIRLSSFLGHPIIVATHHHDFTSNFARIEAIAGIVNDIASPRWMTIEDISRTNYTARMEQDLLCVKPLSRRLVIPLISDIKGVQLLASPFGPETTIHLAPLAAGGSFSPDHAGTAKCSVSDNLLEIVLPPHNPLDFTTVKGVPLGLWPVARRLLAEGRDRAKPILSAVSGR